MRPLPFGSLKTLLESDGRGNERRPRARKPSAPAATIIRVELHDRRRVVAAQRRRDGEGRAFALHFNAGFERRVRLQQSLQGRRFVRMPGLLTLDDAAAYLAIAPKTLRNWASQRRLPVVKLSGEKGPIRFRVADLDAFILKSVRPAIKLTIPGPETGGRSVTSVSRISGTPSPLA